MSYDFVPPNRLFLFYDGENAVSDMVFRYKIRAKDKSIVVCFQRPLQDPWAETVVKIQSKIASATEPKAIRRKRRSQDFSGSKILDLNPDYVVSVGIRDCKTGVMLETANLSNHEVLEVPGTEFFVDDVIYEIVAKSPRVPSLKIDMTALVGYPVMPSVDFDNENDRDNFQFYWFVAPPSGQDCKSLSVAVNTENSPDNSCKYGIEGWEFRDVGRSFIPKGDDTGKTICILCIGSDTIGRLCMSKSTIVDPTVRPIWIERQKLCADKLSDDRFRLMSYNVLADLYLDLKVPRSDWFFPYCEKQFQERYYRYPLLLREIPGYNCDVMCLQEVDFRLYMRFLDHYLCGEGFKTLLKLKSKDVNEGLVIAFRRDRFDLVGSHDAVLSDLLDSENQEFADLRSYAGQTADLLEFLRNRATVIQVTALSLKQSPKTIFIVATSHLHFHPLQPHVKLVQTALCIRHLEDVVKNYRTEIPSARIVTVFTGDLNSTPTSGVFEFLTNSKLARDHADWQSGQSPEHLEGVDLHSNLQLCNACEIPPYTNYTKHEKSGSSVGFAGCLDYIWLSKDLRVDRVIPMPSHDLVTEFTALPSKTCPSDHLPIICDVSLQK